MADQSLSERRSACLARSVQSDLKDSASLADLMSKSKGNIVILYRLQTSFVQNRRNGES
ncbi:hypothetical protein CsSME_00010011 [Camellia sinensis var. sinensis]